MDRFGVAVRLADKSAASVISAVDRRWISLFGPMKRLLADPGGENVSSDFVEFCEHLNIEHHTTAAQAEFSNGIVERFGASIREIVLKLSDEFPRMHLDDLLAKAASAYNDLLNAHGYSPVQLVTGVRPHLPSSITNQLPALDYDVADVHQRVLAISAARRAMIAVESSDRIRQALKANVKGTTPANALPLHSSVYFYHDATGRNRRGWRGPGTIVGTDPDSRAVLILYGGRIWSRHVTRVKLAGLESTPESPPTQSPTAQSPEPQLPVVMSIEDVDNDDDDDDDGQPGGDDEVFDDSDSQENSTGSSSSPQSFDSSPSDSSQSSPHSHSDSFPSPSPQSLDSSLSSPQSSNPPPQARRYMTRQYRAINGDESGTDDALVTFEKAKEKFVSQLPHVVYFVSDSKKIVPIDSESKEFAAAKAKELQSFLDNDVYEKCHVSILPAGTQIISSRFVLSWKDMGDGIKMAKARLVARGFQEDVSDEAVDAPTASPESLRLACVMGVQHGWTLQSIDVKTAFLQADDRGPDDKIIAIAPPREAGEQRGIVWKLKKSMYGLRSAPKAWWNTLSTSLVNEFHFHQCANDQAAFTLVRDGVSVGVITLHVDDLLVAGNQEFFAILEKLKKRFEFGSVRSDKFVHTGLEIARQADGSVCMSQQSYIESLSEIALPQARLKQVDSPLTADETQQLRGLVGSLLWISRMTRLDIAVDMCVLSTKLATGTVAEILRANKTMRYLKGSSHHKIVYRSMSPKLSVIAYADSAFQNLDRAGSQGGHIMVSRMEELTSPSSHGKVFASAVWCGAHSPRNCFRRRPAWITPHGFDRCLMR